MNFTDWIGASCLVLSIMVATIGIAATIDNIRKRK